MAKKKKKNKTKSINFKMLETKQDKEILNFLELQTNKTWTIKLALLEVMKKYGIKDLICLR